MAENRFRIFFLGAGFSKAAGYPLGKQLWEEIQRRARNLTGRAGEFHSNLRGYIRFKRECDGDLITADEVNFEDFMRFLDVEHFLRLRGSDTWSRDGNEGTVLVKSLIGEILAEKTPVQEEVPDVYLAFADGLQPNDHVLTFNYDTLLETALSAVGKPFRLFPSRYESVREDRSFVDDSRQEVIVLKLHGSIDWFDRSRYTYLEACHRNAGLTTNPQDPVFAHTEELGVRKLLEGPRHLDDPLNQMFRVRDVKSLYKKATPFRATPWLLSPSTWKLLYADKIRDFWYGMGGAGILNFGLSIIGYSLPPQDEYAKQILYAVVTNYQQTYWGEDVLGARKAPLVIVDRCAGEDALTDFKARYRFVDWNRATLYVEGFDSEAVRLVHAAS